MDHPVMCGRLRLNLGGGGCGAQDRTKCRIEKTYFSLLLFWRASSWYGSIKDLSSCIAFVGGNETAAPLIACDTPIEDARKCLKMVCGRQKKPVGGACSRAASWPAQPGTTKTTRAAWHWPKMQRGSWPRTSFQTRRLMARLAV